MLAFDVSQVEMKKPFTATKYPGEASTPDAASASLALTGIVREFIPGNRTACDIQNNITAEQGMRRRWRP